MSIQKTIVAILTVLIVTETGYLASLIRQWRALETGQNQPEKTAEQPTRLDPPNKQQPPDILTSSVPPEPSPPHTMHLDEDKSNLQNLIQRYQTMLENAPDDVDTRWELAKLLQHIPGKKAESLHHMKEILKLQPDFPKKKFVQQWINKLSQDE